jgi:hypothetical protein
MPCEFVPETLMVPLLVMTLLPAPPTTLPFANMPGEPAPVVVMVPLLTSVSFTVSAAIPADPSPVVESRPLLVSVPPPELAKSCIASESVPLVWITPLVSLSIVTAAAPLKRPSDSLPLVTSIPRLINMFWPAPLP